MVKSMVKADMTGQMADIMKVNFIHYSIKYFLKKISIFINKKNIILFNK